MKVLVNAISAKRGGIVTYTQNMIRWMNAQNIDATFAVPRDFAGDGPNLLRVNASEYRPLTRLAWEQAVWPAIVARHKPDILFSSANFGLFYAPVPQVLLIREGGLLDPFYLANFGPAQGVKVAFLRNWRRQLMLASASWASRVVTPSAAMRDLILGWRPALGSKIDVCPYGTRGDMFLPRAEARRWRADGTFRLIYVSVYYPHKNPGVICEAVRKLDESGLRTRATITMDLNEIAQARGSALDTILVKRAVAAGDVTLGHRHYAELPALYAAHDVFVFPSVSESFGHPMAEAMSTGLPSVVADTPINREICGDGALYFNPFSPSDLAARLRELDSDPALRERLSANGRARASSLYRWDDHMQRLMAIFERVMAEKSVVRRPA